MPRGHPRGLSPSRVLGRASPGWERKVSVSLGVCEAASPWVSHASSLGFRLHSYSVWARRHLPCHSATAALGAPLAVVLSLSSLCCHPPSRVGASGTGRGRVCPCSGAGAESSRLITDVACRGQARPHWVLPGCTWGHCPPPTWPALLSPDRQTVPATFLHRLQPLLQDPPQVRGACKVPGTQGQSQGGNRSSLRGPGPAAESWPRPHGRLRCVPALMQGRTWDSQGCGADDGWYLAAQS